MEPIAFGSRVICPYCTKTMAIGVGGLPDHNAPGGRCDGAGRAVTHTDSMGRAVFAGHTDRPLADKGLTSYRYRGRYGWVMIGARDNQDALNEAKRSVGGPVSIDNLEAWDGNRYVPAK